MSDARAPRVVLVVPASEPGKVAKAAASRADEVCVDLEDAVVAHEKPAARAHIADLAGRAGGSISVRVNAIDSPWFCDDVEAVWANAAVESIVVPKVETPEQLELVDALLRSLESTRERRSPLAVQALIETAAGIVRAAEIARHRRAGGLILGYADLAASLGRRPSASWQFARDAVVFGARAAGIQAIDGPVLTVDAGPALAEGVDEAVGLGFDGKWVIHPRQIDTVLDGFTPSEAELADARRVLEAVYAAAREGRGAVALDGRMLDEALAAHARRTLARSRAAI